MKQLRPLLWLVLIGIAACSHQKPETITYQVARRDFTEKILGTGTIESANNFTIVAPSIPSSNIKVDHLVPEGYAVETGDTVCILAAPDIQNYYDQFDKDLEKTKAQLARQEADNNLQISLLNAQLSEIEINRSLQTLDSLQVKFSPPVIRRIKELELKKNQIQEQKVLKKITAQKKINTQSLRALQSQVIQKEQLVQQFRDQIDQCTITAPKAGMMVYATSPTHIIMDMSGQTIQGGGKVEIGSTVRRRMPLVQLPDLDSMQIVLMVQEAEYKRIEKGQKVSVFPGAMPGFETTGTITTKSLASQPMAHEYKVKSYKVVIDIDSLDRCLQPGLSADCEILIQHIPDQITIPSVSIFERDSTKLVYILKDDQYVSTVVETGQSSLSETIITSGLNGEEIISLLEPPVQLIKKDQ